MARIALLVSDLGARRVDAISAIRRRFPVAIGEIIRRTSSHEAVAELELHGTELERRAAEFRELATDLQKMGASTEMVELLEGERLPESYSRELVRVDIAMIDRMVTSIETEHAYSDVISSAEDDEEDEPV